jgi:hypothetical protein
MVEVWEVRGQMYYMEWYCNDSMVGVQKFGLMQAL